MLRGWEVRGRGLLIALLIALAPAIAALPVPAAARAAAATYLYDGLQPTSPHAPAMQTVHSSRNTTAPSGPLVLLDRPAESAASRDAANTAAGSSRALSSVDDVLSSLAKGRSAGVRTVGSETELQSTFDTLTSGGSPIEWPGYKGTVIERSDGVQVGIRSGSKSGGPTIDVRMPDGTIQKVHIG